MKSLRVVGLVVSTLFGLAAATPACSSDSNVVPIHEAGALPDATSGVDGASAQDTGTGGFDAPGAFDDGSGGDSQVFDDATTINDGSGETETSSGSDDAVSTEASGDDAAETVDAGPPCDLNPSCAICSGAGPDAATEGGPASDFDSSSEASVDSGGAEVGPALATLACCALRCAGGANVSCSDPSFCVGGAISCTGRRDCPSGQVCCGASFMSQPLGTECATTCPSGRREVCRNASDCSVAGSTCSGGSSTVHLYKTCRPPVPEAGPDDGAVAADASDARTAE